MIEGEGDLAPVLFHFLLYIWKLCVCAFNLYDLKFDSKIGSKQWYQPPRQNILQVQCGETRVAKSLGLDPGDPAIEVL